MPQCGTKPPCKSIPHTHPSVALAQLLPGTAPDFPAVPILWSPDPLTPHHQSLTGTSPVLRLSWPGGLSLHLQGHREGSTASCCSPGKQVFQSTRLCYFFALDSPSFVAFRMGDDFRDAEFHPPVLTAPLILQQDQRAETLHRSSLLVSRVPAAL